MLKIILLTILVALLFVASWAVFAISHWPVKELWLVAAGITVIAGSVTIARKLRR